MSKDEFSRLLQTFMRRIRASAAGVASEIHMSREAVNNWRNGISMPSPKHRDKVLSCAAYLRLTEAETNTLLCAAGFSPEYLLAEDLPSRLCATYINHLFERLSAMGPYPIMMLLSQASWGEPPFREALQIKAQQVYGDSRVMHVQPPFSLSVETADYFKLIGEQCGLQNVTDDFAFERALELRLKMGETLFMIVSRFEQGVTQLRESLAGILRSLSEMYPGQLHLMLCGGERLAALKYQNGEMSLLNIALVEYWPQLSVDEVLLLANHRYPGLMLNQHQAEILLQTSGGHPGLINLGLDMRAAQQQPVLDHYPQWFEESDLLWQAFSRINAQYAERLQELLKHDDLGPARPYISDPALAALFWQNLIQIVPGDNGKRLQWRCPSICEAGRRFVAQEIGSHG